MKALAALSQFVNKTFALWVLVFAQSPTPRPIHLNRWPVGSLRFWVW